MTRVEKDYTIMGATITVDADVPPGACVTVTVRGVGPCGLWEETFSNPHHQPIPPGLQGFSFQMVPPPSSIAIPFVYAIIIEADGAKTTHTAERLAAGQDLEALGWVLTRPMGGRPFLTRPWMQGADISASDIQRPWVLEVEGDTPGDSSILFVLRGTESDGTVWEQEFYGPCREELQSTTLVEYQYVSVHGGDPRGI